MEEKQDFYFLVAEVLFSLVFAIFASVLLYNFVGFQVAHHLSLVLRWCAIVVIWGWIMVLSLYGVNRWNRKWRKKTHWMVEIALSFVMGIGLVYFLFHLFR